VANLAPRYRTAWRTRRLSVANRTSLPRRQRCGRWVSLPGNRSSTSKQMCQPAVPIETNPWSILCQRVRRVRFPRDSISHRMSLPPQLYSSLGASALSIFQCAISRRSRSKRKNLALGLVAGSRAAIEGRRLNEQRAHYLMISLSLLFRGANRHRHRAVSPDDKILSTPVGARTPETGEKNPERE